MLAKVCLKRFRFVLYAALFFLITLHITDRTNSGPVSYTHLTLPTIA